MTGTNDVGMKEGGLDLVEWAECARPEAEHLAGIVLKDTELVAPDPASDGSRLGATNDEQGGEEQRTRSGTYGAWDVVLFSEIASAKTVCDERDDDNDERGKHWREREIGTWNKKETVLSESLLPYMVTRSAVHFRKLKSMVALHIFLFVWGIKSVLETMETTRLVVFWPCNDG